MHFLVDRKVIFINPFFNQDELFKRYEIIFLRFHLLLRKTGSLNSKF